MRSSNLRYGIAVFGLVILALQTPSWGEEYLVIKRKDGSTQKVPLQIPPEEIESMDVEAPGPDAKPRDVQREPADKEPAAKPMEIAPGRPPTAPGAKERPEAPARPFAAPPEVREAPLEPERPFERVEERPLGPRPAEKPFTPEKPPAPARGPVSGPPAAPAGMAAIGSFTANVYQIPDNVKQLPDYSSFRPNKTLTADAINIDPASGDRQLIGLPEKTDGIGLRFVALFRVSGEGIFRFRVNSKDGVRVHVDDKTLIENDGIHAAASKSAFVHLGEGIHSILVDSFNSTGKPTLQLFQTPPFGDEEVFSASKGLKGWKEPDKPYDVLWGQVYFAPKGDYPKGPDFSKISPIGRVIAPELSISGGEQFPGLPGRRDMIGVRYEGYFPVQGAGIFAFRLRSDKYAKLTIGKHDIVEASGAKADSKGDIGWAFLQEGSYPVSVDYFHQKGAPLLELYVTQPGKQEELFAPSRPLVGYSTDAGKMNMIPAFVYFLTPGANKVPNFNKLAPSGMFFTRAIDYPIDRGSREFPGVPKREEWLGIRFYVKFSISEREEGEYKFRMLVEDAGRLIVGKKLVINAESFGRPQEKSGSVTLAAGSHEMFVDYVQGSGPNGIQLYITPPGGEEKIFAFQ